jgi:glycosyltransferase involved in cell wall biosynthesis
LFLFPVLRQSAAAIGLGVLQRRYFEGIGIDASRLFTVALTPHLDRFRLPADERTSLRAALRQEWHIPESAVVGMCVARLAAVKGPDLLLAAMESIPGEHRPHLVLVGDGPLRAGLEAAARQRGLPIYFTGFRQNDELPRLFCAADFFVLPSREEPWGIAVAEAMASGLPVVLSDQVGAAYDLLQPGENGFLVTAGAVSSLQTALERCVRQRDRLPEMGRKSQALVAGWNGETSTREFFRAIDVALRRTAT